MEDTSTQSLLDMQREARAEANKEKLTKLFQDKNPFENASLWQKMFFKWTEPVIAYSKDNQLDIKMLGKVAHKDSVEVQLAKLEACWERRKNQPDTDNALSKALFSAFKGELIYATFWNFVVTLL